MQHTRSHSAPDCATSSQKVVWHLACLFCSLITVSLRLLLVGERSPSARPAAGSISILQTFLPVLDTAAYLPLMYARGLDSRSCSSSTCAHLREHSWGTFTAPQAALYFQPARCRAYAQHNRRRHRLCCRAGVALSGARSSVWTISLA